MKQKSCLTCAHLRVDDDLRESGQGFYNYCGNEFVGGITSFMKHSEAARFHCCQHKPATPGIELINAVHSSIVDLIDGIPVFTDTDVTYESRWLFRLIESLYPTAKPHITNNGEYVTEVYGRYYSRDGEFEGSLSELRKVGVKDE